MRELKFNRLSEDGTHFVLKDSRGVTYRLTVDEPLATAARRGLQRTASRTDGMAMSPRHIQALIRGGMSIDEVVAATGQQPDFVQRFAEPVLAEIEFIVQRARRMRVRLGSSAHTLDEIVDIACERADVPTDDVQWLCAREDDGCWRIRTEADGQPLVEVRFRVTDGTITPTQDTIARLAPRTSVVTLPESSLVGSLPAHWDAQHPAARAAARHVAEATDIEIAPAPPAPARNLVGSHDHSSPPLFDDDPSSIF